MSDLIDREKLISELQQTYSILNRMDIGDANFQNGELQELENVIETVKYAPTVDATPVVRCGNCANRYTKHCPLSFYGAVMPYDWFCADGRPKEARE